MYEVFEHTADMGIRARAGSLDALFAEAARGLFSVMVANLDAVRTTDVVAIQLKGDGLEELFHDWLAELLYIYNSRRLVLSRFDVQTTPTGLTATARGELIDANRHEIDAEVKAITWCGLKVQQQSEGWLAEVIVDV